MVIGRGLSVGVTIRQVVWRELLTGVLVGVALALVAFPLVYWRWGVTEVGPRCVAVAPGRLLHCHHRRYGPTLEL